MRNKNHQIKRSQLHKHYFQTWLRLTEEYTFGFIEEIYCRMKACHLQQHNWQSSVTLLSKLCFISTCICQFQDQPITCWWRFKKDKKEIVLNITLKNRNCFTLFNILIQQSFQVNTISTLNDTLWLIDSIRMTSFLLYIETTDVKFYEAKVD